MTHALLLGVRAFLRQPRLMSVLVVTLALGIGANTAVFTVLDTVLLRPLPYPEPDRLVRLFEANEVSPRMGVSNPNFEDWQTRATSVEAIAAFAGGPETVLGGTEPVVANLYAVTRDFFRVLAVQPRLGRVFAAEEHQVGGIPAVVVTDAFWRRALGAVTDLSRLRVQIGTHACRVVGVMPRGFAFPQDAELFVPKELEADTSGRTAHNLRVIARLRTGVARAAAVAELNAIAAQLQAEHRGDNDAQRVAVVDLREQLTGRVRAGLVLLQGVVLIVLLAACANVAGVLLTRGAERRREIAIRAALGAGRRALVRHLLGEGIVLAAAGGGLGLFMAWASTKALRAAGPAWLPRLAELRLDVSVLLFTAALCALAVLGFGLLPALHGTRVDLRDALAEGERTSAAHASTRLRQGLVGVEVALALVLLCASGLLLRSLGRVLAADSGFDPRGVMTAEVTLPAVGYGDPPSGAAYFDRLIERLGGTAGISAVGVTSALPLTGPAANGGLRIESRPELSTANWLDGPIAGYRIVSGGYFRAIGVRFLRGRSFEPADGPTGPVAAVVNQAFVDRYLTNLDPIGQRVQFLGMDEENPWLTIVGVVGNVRHDTLETPPDPEVFVNYRQAPFRTRYGMTVAARAASGDPSSIAVVLRAAIRDIDPEVPAVFGRFDEVVRDSVGDRRLTLALLGGFTVVVLVLSIVGVYGVVRHAVEQRRREIGIRLALGAEPASVVGLVMRGSIGGVAGGLVVGLAGSVLAGRALERFLFGITPADPATYCAAVLALGGTGLLAAWLPARQTTRIDPVVALRS